MKELEESAFELVQPLAETGMEDGSEVSTHCIGQDSRASTHGSGVVRVMFRTCGWLCGFESPL